MKKVRHTVEKIQPNTLPSFDQQFWPVLMAICVVCSIAAGAIVTLVKGPWMWGSLLILPAIALFAIYFLFRLEDSVLRRSLQLAILGSLAIHLLILVVTSLFVIFGTTPSDQTVQAARAPEKRIVVSNNTSKLVIHQTNKHETPDTPVEPDKKQTTTQTRPQPVPVVEKKNPVNRQVARKRVEQPDVPRMEKQTSQLRRRTTDVKPVSSQGVAVNSSSAASRSSSSAKETSPAKTEISRVSSDSKPTTSKEATPATASSRAPTQASSQRRPASAAAVASAAKAKARVRERDTKIPRIAAQKPVAQSKQTASKSVKTQSPEFELNRTTATRTTARKESTQPTRMVQQPVAKISSRRQAERMRSTIKSEPVKNTVDRSVASKTPTTKFNIQPVRQSVASESRQRTVQPKSVAISRSTGGTAGAGRSKNLDRVSGGQPSPVQTASDSSNRRQSNRVSENISLSSLQRSTRTDSGTKTESQRTLRAETTKWASRSGSTQPSTKSVQASAANVDSSVSQSRGQLATEKGSAMLDIGPTKIVPEVTANRRSGGGKPELSDSVARTTSPAGGRSSNVAPAPNSPVVVEKGQLASSDSSQLSKEQGQLAELVDRNESSSNDDINATKDSASSLLTGSTETTSQIVSTAERRDGSDNMSTVTSEDAFEAEEEQSGNSRSRIAQAPSVGRQIELGGSQTSNDNGKVAADQLAEDSGSSTIVERATDTMSGGGVLATASNVVAASMAGMPLFASGTSQSERREQTESNPTAQNRSRSDSGRGNSSLQPKIESNLTGQTVFKGRSESSELSVEESSTGNLQRQTARNSPAEAGAALDLDAPEGAVGFADIASRRVGALSDMPTESDNLSPTRETRFKRSETGGTPSVIPNATIAKEAFRKRNPAALANSGPSTEAAIEMGLEFLARHQLVDGSWTLGQFDTENPLYQSQLNSDTAATGLALLAFQGAGYNHREYKYAAQVKRAVDWLIANQADDGGLYIESDKSSNASGRMYSHAIAALALTEAYGMTQDSAIRDATQKALDYISNTQDPDRGGWRYYAQLRKRSSDTSVTGWMMMALQSGRLAGLETKQSTMDGIAAWLRVAKAPETESEFRYNPYAADSSGMSRMHGRKASITMTSVGLLMQVYSGWGPQDPRFQRGAEVLLQQLPSDKDSRVRDTYYWYYATQVMKHAGGEYWEKWSQAMHPLLVGSQQTDGDMRGSWHPYKPVPDRWGPQGGRIYVTTMNLLSLEVRYRLLPLYEKTIE